MKMDSVFVIYVFLFQIFYLIFVQQLLLYIHFDELDAAGHNYVVFLQI